MFLRRAAIAALALTLSVASASAAIPNAQNPQAFTDRNYMQQMEAFYRKTILEAYRSVGNRNPAWDESVLQLLESACVYMAWSEADYFYINPNTTTLNQLQTLTETVARARCDDPAVLDIMGMVALLQGNTVDATTRLELAATRLATSKYPIFRAASCYRKLRSLAQQAQDGAKYSQWDDQLYMADLAAVQYKGYEGIEQRFIFKAIDEDRQYWPGERQVRFSVSMDNSPASDPWLRNALGGVIRISAAWDARRGDIAVNVKPEGWRGMAEQLLQARSKLVKAYEQHPDWPEAPTSMITVVMGEAAPPADESKRLWFDRAAAGQIDYESAYFTYIYSILPRWGGDRVMMYDFGLECAATGRYDTRIPHQLTYALSSIRNDLDGSWSFYRAPGVLASIESVLQKYAQVAKEPYQRSYYLSYLAGLAWQVEDYEVAKKAIEPLGTEYSAQGFERTLLIPDRTYSGIRALSGELGNRLLHAEDEVTSNRAADGIKMYSDIAATLKQDDPARLWVRGRTQELRWQQQFRTGRDVSLVPGAAELLGWYGDAGEFAVEGATFVAAKSPTQASKIICGAKFRDKYELSGNIEFFGPKGPPTSAASADAVIHFGYLSPDENFGITFSSSGKDIIWSATGQNIRTARNYGSSVRFSIRCWEGDCQILIDDQEFLPYRSLGYSLVSPDARIALVARGGSQLAVRFSDLKVRQLTQAPAPPILPQ